MLRTAFATTDGTAVDQHFGWSTRFDVYEISADGSHLLESRVLPPAEDDENSKIASRLDSVRDCHILVINDIGGSAAAKVVNAGLHPMKVTRGESIEDFTERLRKVLAGNPPPWLRKVLRRSDNTVWTPVEAS